MSKQERKKFPKVVTPVCTLSFSYLDKPDTEGKYADRKFKAKVWFESGVDLSTLEKAAAQAAEMEWGTLKRPVPTVLRDGDESDDERDHGKVLLNVKSRFRPTIVDAKRRELSGDEVPRSGDRVKLLIEASPYTLEGKRRVTFRLLGVQLIERMNRGGADYSHMFDEEEGYEGFPNTAREADDHGDDPDDF